jgi:hypothetical protein
MRRRRVAASFVAAVDSKPYEASKNPEDASTQRGGYREGQESSEPAKDLISAYQAGQEKPTMFNYKR